MDAFMSVMAIGIGLFLVAVGSVIIWAIYQVLKAFGRTLLTRNGIIAFVMLFTPVSPIGGVWLAMQVIRNIGKS